VQACTFRLGDSLPASVLESWEPDVSALPPEERATARKRRIDAWLDAGHGACWLRDARVAALVEESLLHFDGTRYRLLGWAIMPNHVHALVETMEGWPIEEVAHSWKSWTAHAANRVLGRTGKFWQREYHDRFVRDGTHFERVLRYIEENPVKAGLCECSEDWRWGSARRCRDLPPTVTERIW
jgi:putative DNA methylase